MKCENIVCVCVMVVFIGFSSCETLSIKYAEQRRIEEQKTEQLMIQHEAQTYLNRHGKRGQAGTIGEDK